MRGSAETRTGVGRLGRFRGACRGDPPLRLDRGLSLGLLGLPLPHGLLDTFALLLMSQVRRAAVVAPGDQAGDFFVAAFDCVADKPDGLDVAVVPPLPCRLFVLSPICFRPSGAPCLRIRRVERPLALRPFVKQFVRQFHPRRRHTDNRQSTVDESDPSPHRFKLLLSVGLRLVHLGRKLPLHIKRVEG